MIQPREPSMYLKMMQKTAQATENASAFAAISERLLY